MRERAFSLWVVAALVCGAAADEAPEQVRIFVAASKGMIIPQSRGGGGFQRSFRFRAVPARSGRWIRQELQVRGTVIDEEGRSTPVHLDVIEYYRVRSSGRTIQADSHYSQFWEYHGGDLTISSKLTYGELEPRKRGDTIVSKSFILRSAVDADGEAVIMRKRTTFEVIPAENGERVVFERHEASIPSRYSYRVQWDARPGVGSRTQPSGEIETGTWWIEAPDDDGPTRAVSRPKPIPTKLRR